MKQETDNREQNVEKQTVEILTDSTWIFEIKTTYGSESVVHSDSTTTNFTHTNPFYIYGSGTSVLYLHETDF